MFELTRDRKLKIKSQSDASESEINSLTGDKSLTRLLDNY